MSTSMNGRTLCAMSLGSFALFLTGALASSLATSAADAVGAHTLDVNNRHLLEEVDFETAKAADRAAWAATTQQDGGKRKRALLASYGAAVGKFPASSSSSDAVSSSDKVQPTGYDCLIASSRTALQDCTGFSAYIVPGCCSSSSETTLTSCGTFDTGEDIVCSTASKPYPACCTFRNQTSSACTTYSGSGVTCPSTRPGRACCYSDDNKCNLNYNGGGSSCPSTSDLGCCPA